MNRFELNILEDYIKSSARNKLIFHSQDISKIETVNVGLKISERLYNFKETTSLVMQVTTVIEEILNESIYYNNLFGRYLSIKNVGVLFEPELKCNFIHILDSYSQNNVLFVKWDGEIDSDSIYFLTKETGIKINIKNLSHIVI